MAYYAVIGNPGDIVHRNAAANMAFPENEMRPGQPGGHEFRTTHWTVVLAAGQSRSAQSAAALEVLARTYWYPLYAYVRRRGHDEHDAKDLTQEFFARLFARNDLSRLDRERGKFRAFLLASMNHFLAKDWRDDNTLNRGGGQTVLSLDAAAEGWYLQEPATDETPKNFMIVAGPRRSSSRLRRICVTSLWPQAKRISSMC